MKIRYLFLKAAKNVLPRGVRGLLRRTRGWALALNASGPKSYCPVCGKTCCFLPAGSPSRPGVRCPRCGSLERCRLLWLFLQKHTDMFQQSDLKVLHVAAEPCFENHFRKLFGKNYITADLYNPEAMVKMDVMDIRYPDEAFDVIICNHVLEHVADDIKAMSEFYRVLKKGGWAIPLVPEADMEKTYEDRSITGEAGRLEAFGQEDHVRMYGKDYADRLKSAGFNVGIIGLSELANRKEAENMRLEEEKIYYCKK